MAGFDFNSLEDVASLEDAGVEVHINDINGDPMYDGDQKVTITVAGRYSKTYRRAEETQRKRPIKRQQLTGESIARDSIALVAACTLAWQGFTADGKAVPCNPDNATRLYKNAPWVLDQVLEAMNDHASFFKSSSAA